MGVNAGAFFGILLCGYLGEMVGWSWGFGLAGIFMLFGLLQFWKAQDIFGEVGKVPLGTKFSSSNEDITDKLNPFTSMELIVIGIAAVLGLSWTLTDPLSKITKGSIILFPFTLGGYSGSTIAIFTAVIFFLSLVAFKLPMFSKIRG